MFLLIGLHILFCKDKKREIFFVFITATAGLVADILLTEIGIYQFNPEPHILPTPLWLYAIWLAFCCTLRHSLSFALKFPITTTLSAAVLAPLSYIAASSLGAVTLPYGTTYSYLTIGLTWLLLTPIILFINKKI